MAALAALLGMLAAWHPARVAVQALLLLPALFPQAPVDPLGLLSAPPSHTSQTLEYAGGSIKADLFAPGGASEARHGAVVLLLGAGDVPLSDLAVHFAEALARSGVVVLLAQSDGLLAERLSFREVDGIRAEVGLLDAQPDVDRSRVGIVALSAAGGLSIVAAAQPSLRDNVAFVNSFGSYANARTLLLDVASRSIVPSENVVQSWTPEQRTLEVIAIALIDTLPDDADRMLLRQAFVEHAPIDEAAWAGLSPAAQRIRELLGGTSREQAAEDIAALPSATLARLDELSPTTYLDQLHARLYLMHDVDDPFIPFTESRELARQAPPGVVQRFTEFSIFAHVIPDRAVPWQTFVPDLWRLFWHVHAVLLELL